MASSFDTEMMHVCYPTRREIQRLHGEREELLRSLRVSESPFRCSDDADATQNLSSMLVYRDRVVEQLDSEQGKMAYLRQEVFVLTIALLQTS